MSKYNVGDVVRIASAETIKERGLCGLGAVAPPYGFHWALHLWYVRILWDAA